MLGLSRSSLYYEPATETAENLRLMRLLDEEYTAHPFLGSRRLTKWLNEQGEQVNRKRVQRLLRAMGLEARLAAEVALNVSMDTLLDPQAARARLVDAARACVAAGAGTVILGCTGMAHHRAAVEDAAGVPVIEPCQAAAGVVLGSIEFGARSASPRVAA